MSILQGVVSYDDATPAAHVKLFLEQRGIKQALTTDTTGAFRWQIPVGKAYFYADTFAKELTLTAGEQRMDFTIPRPGIVLTLELPAAMPPIRLVGAMEHRQVGYNHSVTGVDLGGHRYWFLTVPDPDSVTFTLYLQDDTRPNRITRTWTFTDAVPSRDLTWKVRIPKKYPLDPQIIDDQQQPICNTTFDGMLCYRENQTHIRYQSLIGVTTDEDGRLILPEYLNLEPGQCYLTLKRAQTIGPTTTFTMDEAGQWTPWEYVFVEKVRPTVTQVVFNKSGTRVPGATVHASYIWAGEAIFIAAQSDVNGVVTWKNLPQVRVITWGDGVAAGVIPPTATTVTTPLPAPIADQGIWTNLRFDAPEAAPCTLSWRVIQGEFTYDRQQTFPAPLDENRSLLSDQISVTCGGTFSLIAVLRGPKPQMQEFSRYYFPYNDVGGNVTLPLTLQDMCLLHGAFSTVAGTAVPGVSHLDVLAEEGDVALEHSQGLLFPVTHADGTFDLLLPPTGRYRLLVDLLSAPLVNTDPLVFTSRPGPMQRTFTLPDPLATVPAGTVFKYLLHSEPDASHTLQVATYAAQMPVFGAKADLLAYWYQTSPSVMQIWSGLTPTQPATTAVLRAVHLAGLLPTAAFGAGQRVQSLFPPLKSETAQRGYIYDDTPEEPEPPGSSDVSSINTRHVPGGVVQLWSGTYFAGGTLTVPAHGPSTYTAPVTESSPVVTVPVGYLLQINKTDADTLMTISDRPGLLIRDNGIVEQIRMSDLRYQRFFTFDPSQKSFSLFCPGVGVIKDVPISSAHPSEYGGTNAVIFLPAWQTGVSIRGTLLDSAGKPCSRQFFILYHEHFTRTPAEGTRILTDGQGKFEASGLIPGTYYLVPHGLKWRIPWRITVPEGGITGLELRNNAQAITFSEAYDWWVPDDGKPVPLGYTPYEHPSFFQSGNQEALAGPGTVWKLSSDGSGSACRHLIARPGLNQLGIATIPEGGTLGLTLPLTDIGDKPSVVLTGLGRLTGIHYTLTPTWTPSTALGRLLTRIAPVLPGEYEVAVQTTHGTFTRTITVTPRGVFIDFSYPAQTNTGGRQ